MVLEENVLDKHVTMYREHEAGIILNGGVARGVEEM